MERTTAASTPIAVGLEEDGRWWADAVVREVLIAGHPKTLFEQGLGLFGSQEYSALLDEVVAIAYAERKRPAKTDVDLTINKNWRLA